MQRSCKQSASTTNGDPIRAILNRLGDSPKSTGAGKWSAKCPAHDDRQASLSITAGDDGRALLHCHAGCETESVCAALGMKLADLYPPKDHHRQNGNIATRTIVATYPYRGVEGELLYEVVRFAPKDFRQRQPDGKGGWTWSMSGVKRVLYRLPELVAAFEDRPNDIIFIVEGEKDVDALRAAGLVSTCNVGGAGKWRDEYSETLRGQRCCIIADKDEPGRKHAQQVAASLTAHGATEVKIIEVPGAGKDAADYLAADGTADQLLAIVEAAPKWEPSPMLESTAVSPGESGDRATELANAEDMHRRHGPKIKYHKDRGEFFVYSGTHWGRDIFGQVNRWGKEVARNSAGRLESVVDGRELSRFAKQVESARGIGGVLKLLETEPGIPATADDFDRHDYLLNVANGTLELRTATLRPHDARDMITHCLATPFNQHAKCLLWESVVNRAMADNADLVSYLQRWAGSFLTGASNIHELLICYGSGANGKSVIFDTLLGLLGDLGGVAPESLLVARHGQSDHPTEIADLMGKRLVVASETESGATLRLQLIKRLTGDLIIKARFMRQDFFQFRRTWKMVLITNSKPRLTENTEAVWRRLRLLPFNVVIPPAERDSNLLEKLRAERPGILSWAVRGCVEVLRDGMNPPDEVLVATKQYRDEADELAPFIEARCIVGGGETFRVSRADIYAVYSGWAKQNNERHPLERGTLFEAIRRLEGVAEGSWKVDGQAVRGFKGIGLASATPEGCR